MKFLDFELDKSVFLFLLSGVLEMKFRGKLIEEMEVNIIVESWSNISDKNLLLLSFDCKDYVYLFEVVYYGLFLCGVIFNIMVVFVMV